MPTIEDYLGAIADDLLGMQLYSQSELVPEPDVTDGVAGAAGAAAHGDTHGSGTSYSGGSRRRPQGSTGMTPDQVAQMNTQIQQQFGVGTAGQWRSAANDSQRRARTGRKSVSDHVSGQAIDITGSPEKLDKVAAWAATQPNVKNVLWRTKDHWDHVHISYWGAQ